MPKVVAMLEERRRSGMGEHINLCWRRGVLQREPGWFFAAEGAITVGMPDGWVAADAAITAMRQQFPGTAVLTLKEVNDGQA